MEDALRLFLKERNDTIAGRKVGSSSADTAGQRRPQTKAQELIGRTRSRPHRPARRFEALAIDDTIRSSETPTISPSAAAED